MEGDRRLVLIEPVTLEQSSLGEVLTRPVSHIVYARRIGTPIGGEGQVATVLQVHADSTYRVRRESLPPNVDEGWTLVEENGVESDIVSIQPVISPSRSNWLEIKAVRRMNNKVTPP